MPSVWMALIQRELKTGFDILLRSGPFALVHTANTDTSSIPHFAIVVGFIAKYFLAHNRLENPLRKKKRCSESTKAGTQSSHRLPVN